MCESDLGFSIEITDIELIKIKDIINIINKKDVSFFIYFFSPIFSLWYVTIYIFLNINLTNINATFIPICLDRIEEGGLWVFWLVYIVKS